MRVCALRLRVFGTHPFAVGDGKFGEGQQQGARAQAYVEYGFEHSFSPRWLDVGEVHDFPRFRDFLGFVFGFHFSSPFLVIKGCLVYKGS